jgi:DNA-binding NarL/FixJ family response regulator
MRELIASTDDIELCATYQHAGDAIRHVRYYQPDLVIMDIDMKPVNGLEGLRLLRIERIEIPILMLTVFDDNDRIFQAICNGASGYLLKSSSPEKIVESIREAVNGGAPMTPSIAKQVLKLFSAPYQKPDNPEKLTTKELAVLSYLIKGYSYKLIAAEMSISIETIRFHIKNIYTKLHVNSKSEAVVKALQNKLI